MIWEIKIVINTPDEYALCKATTETAKKHGLSVAEYVRQLIENDLLTQAVVWRKRDKLQPMQKTKKNKFRVICDGCGWEHEGLIPSFYAAKKLAKELGFLRSQGKDYCRTCQVHMREEAQDAAGDD